MVVGFLSWHKAAFGELKMGRGARNPDFRGPRRIRNPKAVQKEAALARSRSGARLHNSWLPFRFHQLYIPYGLPIAVLACVVGRLLFDRIADHGLSSSILLPASDIRRSVSILDL